MAHPMYKMDDLLKKYPLVEKAFDRTEGELEAAVFVFGGEQAVIETPRRIIEVVIQNVDGTDAEKQALIIGVMYALSPQALQEDRKVFGSQYGLAAQAVIEDFRADDKDSVASTNVARIRVVVGLCQISIMTPMFREIGKSLPQKDIQKMKSEALKEEKRLFPNLNAPKLEKLHKKTMESFFSVLENNAVPQSKNKKNSRKKSGNPRP